MDAFAVSICKGLGMRTINYRHAFIIALFFGGFQMLMPLIGWALGVQFQHYITSIDHWIAFVLLGGIGAKMIHDALRTKDEECPCEEMSLNVRQLLLLAIATSIDALAVGITFAFLQVDIVASIIVIGCITFCLAFVGVIVGNRFGNKYEKRAMMVGGIVLIAIGLKILLEHFGLIG